MKIAFQSFRTTMLLMLICGILYPLGVTAMAIILFPYQASGSLVMGASGQVLGSELIAQGFKKPRYFHPRPSASLTPDGSGPQPYDGAFSSPSNLGPDNAQEIKTITDAAVAYRQENHLSSNAKVPIDAVTASGSGLDPDISLSNALLQAPRVAEARNLNLADVQILINRSKTGPQFGFLGTPRVNVLKLNIALDRQNP
ncbi:MAG: potassium-transporting ATPase subunit KdpC [Leptospirales bacterium]